MVWLILAIIFISLYIYTILTTISVVLLENRTPQKSVVWVLILLLVPVFGLIFYLIFGQDIRRRKYLSRKNLKKIQGRLRIPRNYHVQTDQLADLQQQGLIRLLEKNSGAIPYVGNRVATYTTGQATFDAIFDAIRSATHHVHVEFFIIENDIIGNQLRELLIQKARAGVCVRLIYDYLGGLKLSKDYLQSLRDAGVQVRAFMPVRFEIFGRIKLWGKAKKRGHINFRNHRKIVIVDGRIGFTGGHNVADRYIVGNKLGAWRDTFARIEGPAVYGLQMNFLTDWYFVDQSIVNDPTYYPALNRFEDNCIVQIVASSPDSDWETIMQGIAKAVLSATRYVYIHTPYFMPPEKVLSAIHSAALSGVDVRVIVPQKSDAPFTSMASRTYVERLLRSGVQVFLYDAGFIHSKAIVIDDKLSLIGSANLDERSANQMFELNAFVYDEPTARQMREYFLEDQSQSVKIQLSEWLKRPRRERLKESFARLFSPLM